ncbi:Retinoblastoma-binding protein [Coemansia sp. RSA 1822]|nr:Retinoblastoma-binding protein [Coemansia sp. RSA 638]KAJ2542906.1 Retinoblastoma-binding protein [Coemansia sp. RSA 1853]KAJ2566105.1 Retinoblastoma-binding protein [Coemansia sp. RSA 1822]
MSHIQYKFRSSKDYSTAVFDGLSIPVAELKQEILREQKLNPEDFDLVITNEQTSEDYKDDSALIPKNTVVLVRRIPYTGPKMGRMGAGSFRPPPPGYNGMPYGGGGPRGPPTGPGSQYGYRGPQGVGMGSQRGAATADQSDTMDTDTNDPDDARITAMLQQSSDQWMHQQSIMDMQRPVGGRGGFRGRPNFVRPEHQQPPPPGYVCHRCGMQGHWIYSCPTQSQSTDGSGKPNMHRVKRTTGIPKSFLQKVENLDDVGNALVTSDGTLVVATANEAAWNTAQRLARNAISTDSDIDSSAIPDELKCTTCQKLVRDAVSAPCCHAVFCSSCVERQLLDPGSMRFVCPACRAGLVPDQLEVAAETRGKADEFLREYSARQNAANDALASDTVSTSNVATPGLSVQNGSASAVGLQNGNVPGSVHSAVSAPIAPPVVSGAVGTGVQRPPAQVPPRPRPMGMMPGMMPGMMMGGFPGMPMGQMPYMQNMQNMPNIQNMQNMAPSSSMMGQWTGLAPPSAPVTAHGSDSANSRSRDASRDTGDWSREHRDHGRDRESDRGRDHSSRSYRDSRRNGSRRRDESSDRRSSRREESTDRRSSRREESTDRRSSRREESTDRRSSRGYESNDRRSSHREGSTDRRSHRRDESVSHRSSRRDESASHRSSRREDSADRRSSRRSGRSRSPARGSRRGGDPKAGGLTIRGQSTGDAAENKPRSVLERLSDNRSTRDDHADDRSGSSRRHRNRRR